MKLIYFAGPLFSLAEKQFNSSLTAKLEDEGFKVFLPQRDGIEKTNFSKEKKREVLFNLDKKRIFQSDIFLFILDGRVPDEGACVELGIAYTHKSLLNKKRLLIGLMTDSRAAFIGGRLNPMVKMSLDFVFRTENGLLSYLKEKF